MTNQEVQKAEGVTPAEKYLRKLCEKAFLSLWSFPTPFRNQGQKKGKGDGRELCDMLVVFGNDVIIFSDKHIIFNHDKPLEVAWRRWFDRAVWQSAGQAWGAVRWLTKYPMQIYLDKACSKPFPITIPINPRIHLIVVAHGISQHIRSALGDSGSLMLASSMKGRKVHTIPFMVGDLDPTKTFVHIFDDESLLTVFSHLDTVPDFVSYLTKREKLFRGSTIVAAAGEEELLAVYLTKMNAVNEHDFVFPIKKNETVNAVVLDRGFWEKFIVSPERSRQLAEDKDSYVWDKLIEHFSKHTLGGTLHSGGFGESEVILRFMASESRFMRRLHGKAILSALQITKSNERKIRVLMPLQPKFGDVYYVFFLLPLPERITYAEYREVRQGILGLCCRILRMSNPAALDIVGIAMEPHSKGKGGSEDICYFDGRQWNPELEKDTRELQDELGIMKNLITTEHYAKEYPDETIMK